MMPGPVNPQLQIELFDDFLYAHDWWTSLDDGGTGTNTLDATAGGQYSVVTAAADNDYHFLVGDAKNWVVADNRPLWFEARLKYTEANTDDANVFVGLSSDIAATVMGDNGAGPPASYSGVNFHKVDGGTAWLCETSNAGVQTTTTTTTTAGGGTFVRLGFHLDTGDGTTAIVTFFIDGVRVAQHKMTLASLAAMGVVAGIKAGAGNAETVTLDYVRCVQQR
jgi:hypothetical protein